MSKRFTDRLVLVTGAGGGLGRAFAQRFASEGASLILTDVDVPLLEETAALLRAQGTVCSTHKFDLASESETLQFAAEICSQHPRLDVLINNAGLAYGEISHSFAALSQQKWLRYFAINSIAPLILAQALRPSLAEAKGVVLNVSSMAAFMPATAYGVTKSSLNAMTYGMANTFGADGIRVNAIAPGLMETPASTAQLPPGTHERIQSQQALKLHGTAEDISALAAFLASDDARFITAEIMSCDAGNRLRGWRS
ncbi:MAG: family oxidoreductase [Hydrocarboniphaga sp.]|uniref:SDR family NAD(P)-dependent oxidoreductase n=1 Tax=Hydrocarboniphaga sp. TaxID=2033016 RepID=UPI00260B50A1|nr:SDR family oxidoreductase [Hydrocarboniphaga sp.]MDB5968663.1 family oxidoreductase [Hydrocarboniphaga sp.]